MIALVAIALSAASCAKKESRPMPTAESVNAAMAVMKELEHTIGLAIIAAVPADPGPSPGLSYDLAEKGAVRAQKNLAFLKGIKNASTGEAVKASAARYLATPSQETADAF